MGKSCYNYHALVQTICQLPKCLENSVLKKEHEPKLLGLDIFRSGGVLPREGVGVKSSVCPSKPRGRKHITEILRQFRDNPAKNVFICLCLRCLPSLPKEENLTKDTEARMGSWTKLLLTIGNKL